ncbi:hypothetical protein Mapa_005333 [Marchantia paleacea]|nr:hypothetical protein Mapa_005333 [Marchantia paleacea]
MALPHGENYDPLFPDQPTVDQYLQVWARQGAFAHKVAFRWVDMAANETHSLSFAQLNDSATVIASELLQRFELSHGDRIIAVFPPTGLQFIELLFGSQRAGLVLVPVSPPDLSSASSSREDHHNLIQRMNSVAPKLIIAPHDYCPTFNMFLRKYRARYGFGNMLNLPMACTSLSHRIGRGFGCQAHAHQEVLQTVNSNGCGQRGCRPEDIYLLQYSSGTTGTPKATMITAGAAAHNVRAVRKAYALQPSSVVVSWLPMYHDCGLMLVLSSVVSGCSMVVTSPFFFVQRPVLWLDALSKFEATVTAVPAFILPLTCSKFESPSSSSKLDLSRLQTLMLMNEPILASLVADFVKTFKPYGLKACAIAPSYGLAELCTFASTAWDPSAESLPISGGIVACGRVAEKAEFDIRIVDPETCVESRDGEEGEIWIASASKAAGYLNDRERSERDLRATMSMSDSSSTFLRTGDLGRVSQEFLFVTGRVADVIVVNGRSWHPQEIEKTVFESSADLLRPGCAVAFSVARRAPSATEGSRRPFVVILAELKDASRDDYRQRATLVDTIRLNLCLNHKGFEASVIGLLPPRTVPKTTSGKLRRAECRTRFIAHTLQLVDIYHVSPFPRTSAL